eukprot:g1185.t1
MLNLTGNRVGRRNYMLEKFVKKRLRIRACCDDESSEDAFVKMRLDHPAKVARGENVEIRILMKQLDRIHVICNYLELRKKVIDHACQFFAHLKMVPEIHGPSRPRNGLIVEDLIAAAIFTACRLNKIPVTRREMCALAKAGKSSRVAKLYRTLIRDLKLEIPEFSSLDFLPRLKCRLRLSEDVARAARILCERSEGVELSSPRVGKSAPAPATTAAASVYIAAHMANERHSPNVRTVRYAGDSDSCGSTSSASSADIEKIELKMSCFNLLHLKEKPFRKICSDIVKNLERLLTPRDIGMISHSGALCLSNLHSIGY